jgi:hypothetical protein
MNVAVDFRLIEINLNIAGTPDLFIIVAITEADSDQAVSRQDLSASARRIGLNGLSNDATPAIVPADAVPGWRFLPYALGKVEYARRYQQRGAGQHQPSTRCEYRSLHLLIAIDRLLRPNNPTRKRKGCSSEKSPTTWFVVLAASIAFTSRANEYA